MRIKKSVRRHWLTLIPGIFVALILMGFLGLVIFPKPKIQSVNPSARKLAPPPTEIKSQSYRGLPIRLKIPAINVDTAIEYMGNTSNGDMAVPNSLVDVGWYKYGPLPGEQGSSVIAGHVVGFHGEPGVFSRLDKLKTGDLISVVDAKGHAAIFTVSGTKIYDPVQQHQEVFNSSSGIHLNLITCAGDWDAHHLHYLKRLVVFADSTP